MNPNKPRTAATATYNFRGDIKALAALAEFYNSLLLAGKATKRPGSKGALARWSIEDFAEVLQEQGKAPVFHSTDEALQALLKLGYVDLQSRGGRKALVDSITLEDINLDTTDNPALEVKPKPKPKDDARIQKITDSLLSKHPKQTQGDS